MAFFILKNKSIAGVSKVARLDIKAAGFKEEKIRDILAE